MEEMRRLTVQHEVVSIEPAHASPRAGVEMLIIKLSDSVCALAAVCGRGSELLCDTAKGETELRLEQPLSGAALRIEADEREAVQGGTRYLQ